MTAGKKQGADAARLAAARVLYEVLEENAYANLSSIRLLEQGDLTAVDRRFASACIYGTLSRLISIDWLLGGVSSRPLAGIDAWTRTSLRLGVWQLYWARSVPAHAAVNETVRLVHWLANPGAAGFANALLRRLNDSRPALPPNNPALFYSLPPELYGYLRKGYGPDEAARMAEAFLKDDVAVTARVNCLRADAAALADELQAAGVGVQAGLYCPEALRLDLGGQPVRGLPAWQAGRLSIQDEAAMLVAHAAAPEHGQTIIDLCAAPGGKSCHLAERSDDRARILAFDVNSERLKLVEGHTARLGLGSVECHTGDASGAGLLPDMTSQADRVLADVPCSGLGLLGRKPEIRLTMTHEKITGLYPLQASILDYAATLLKPGGILIYSTCTVNPAENIGRINAFLAGEGRPLSAGLSITADSLTPHLPENLLKHPDLAETAPLGHVQLLPHRHGLDGFFIARLRRT